jgi:hypothetical protein
MIIIIALLCDLLFKEIRVERTWFGAGRTGYMNVLSRSHFHDDTGLKDSFKDTIRYASPQFRG